MPVESTMPSPHTLILQFAEQSSVLIRLPSSHSSPESSTPLPQPTPCWQSSSQPPGAWPSSQTSPRSLMPLPQVSFDLQSDAHPSGVHEPTEQSAYESHTWPSPHEPLCELPSSQNSPAAVLSTWSPHASADLQSPEQPSPSMMLPSSQTSPGSTMPLPHELLMHTAWTAAHCNGSGLTMPLTHSCAAGLFAQPTTNSAHASSRTFT